MNDQELDRMLGSWEAPQPSPAMREAVRRALPHQPQRRSYAWFAAAASVPAAFVLGAAMMGRGQAQLTDGTYIQSTMQVDPPTATTHWQKLGRTVSTSGNRQQLYVFNRSTHTYTGYDMTVSAKGDGTYLLTVRQADKPVNLGDASDTAPYRERPLAASVGSQVVHDGEPFDIDLVRDPQTGDRVFERIQLARNAVNGAFYNLGDAVQEAHLHFFYFIHSMLGLHHASMRLDSPKLTVDGAAVVQESGLQLAASGVFFYIPDHGRYVMTTDQRDDPRFVRAGTATGSTLEFAMDGHRYRVESRDAIAGSGPSPLFVFHEESYHPNPELAELGRPYFAAGRPRRGE